MSAHAGRAPARRGAEAPAPATHPPAPRPAERSAGFGNQDVQRLLREHGAQAHLVVNPPDDEYEAEAERVARELSARKEPTPEPQRRDGHDPPKAQPTVQRSPAPAGAAKGTKEGKGKKEPEKPKPAKVQRRAALARAPTPEKGAGKEKEDRRKKKDKPQGVQRSPARQATGLPAAQAEAPAAPAGVPDVSPALESTLASRQGGGTPLPAPTRSRFEAQFGHDFSSIRVHADAEAARAAEALGADAFTHGRDVYFARGRYRPETAAGRHLLAHELTHTIQQGAGAPRAEPSPESRPAAAARPAPRKAALRRSLQRTGDDAAAGPTAPSPGEGGAGAREPGGYARPSPGQLTHDQARRAKTQGPDPGTLSADGRTVLFDTLPVPPSKAARRSAPAAPGREAFWSHADSIIHNKGYSDEARPNVQAAKWRRDVAAQNLDAIKGQVARILSADPTRPDVSPADTSTWAVHTHSYVSGPTDPARGRVIVGTVGDIAKELVAPYWNAQGAHRQMQVDHVHELQVSNWPSADWGPDEVSNYQLVEAGVNRSYGDKVKNAIRPFASRFLNAARETTGDRPAREVEDFLKKYHAKFSGIRDGEEAAGVSGAPTGYSWTEAEVLAAAHLPTPLLANRDTAPAKRADFGEMERGLPPDRFLVIPAGELGAATGRPKQFRLRNGEAPVTLADERTWQAPAVITAKRFDTSHDGLPNGDRGHFTLNLPANPKISKESRTFEWRIQKAPGATRVGIVNHADLRQWMGDTRIEGVGSVTIDGTNTVPGHSLHMWGQIPAPGIPLLNGALDYELLGDDLTVSKTFTAQGIRVPRPFSIREAALTVSLGTARGLGATGRVDFGIDRLGESSVEAGASTGGGLALAGEFHLDPELFPPTVVRVAYRDGEWSAIGDVTIPEGRIRGIRSGQVHVEYARGRFLLEGAAQLDVPRLQGASVRIAWSEAEGLAVAGRVDLGNALPGIRSGTLDVAGRQLPEGGWAVSGAGTAIPAIPGVESQLSLSFQDGVFDASAQAAYRRGILSGQIQAGVTNRPTSPDGQPRDGPPAAGPLRIYGGGELTARLSPWLQGTASVRILPNGELEVGGAIRLPAALDVFPARTVERNVFTLGLDIPIVGVAVLGQRIGVFATVRGGLDLSAGVGPGQLRDLALEVAYNPAHEDRTRVTGRGRFHVPAHAGLRLFIRGGLGAGIPVVSASAGLEVGGQLGIEGAATAEVQVDWTPQRGLVLDAVGAISAEPKFRFDVTGYAIVEANLLLRTVELYSRRWQLAAFEYGAGLRLGARFPIHYEEGRPFEMDWNRVHFDVPTVNARQILTDLVRRIA